MVPEVSQLLPQDNILGWILQIVWILFMVVFMFYGQRIQAWNMLRQVQGSLIRLKFMRDEGRRIAILTLKEIGKPQDDPTVRVDQFLEHVAIAPVDLDPSGIVWKLEHVLDVREVRFKDEVKIMAPEADGAQVNNLENMLEAALVLNIIYKVVRHYYILGKRTMSLYIIMQVQMLLPLIMKAAKAYANALRAFTQGQPIGDGAGALVAAKLMHGHEKSRIAKDIVMAKVPIQGRTAYVLKAEGPGANIGKPGDAIKQILEEKDGKIATVIVVDGALKLEGERTGEVAGGVGVAIGGPGVEKYKVDEAVLKQKIPVNAVIIKEDIGDAVSPMRKEIFDAADAAIERIKRLILERTSEGDSVIIAGIGNTVGIGQ
ncbi:MAG: DUF1512 family protein [Candidatus Bathyarchaeia archaeon]